MTLLDTSAEFTSPRRLAAIPVGEPARRPIHVDLSWERALHPSPLFNGAVPGVGADMPPGPAPSPSPAPATGSPREFVRRHEAAARRSETDTAVPALFTLAQAALESGCGKRAERFNFFGIKAKASDPPETRQLWRTREVLSRPVVRSFPEVISVTLRPDGRYDYVVRDWFRAYPSADAAFAAHGRLLSKSKRYRRRSSSSTTRTPSGARSQPPATQPIPGTPTS